MTLEEAAMWAEELAATCCQTAKVSSPVVANDGMPRFVPLPKAAPIYETAERLAPPGEWKGPVSPFSPKKRESEKCTKDEKSKKEKLDD